MLSNLSPLKGALVVSMTKALGGNVTCSRMLRENFTSKELRILKRYTDLLQRIMSISQLRTGPLKLFIETS